MEISMSAPDISDKEREAVAAVLRTPRLSMGPQVERFEAAVAKAAGVEHAVAVSSGTAALHLCIRAAGIREGALVVTTPFSFVASANVMLYERAIPLFVDVEPSTGNIDPQQVRLAVSDMSAGKSGWLPRSGAEHAGEVKAILAVDVFGQPADYDALGEIASEFGLNLIEDASEALGSQYRDQAAGSFGDAAAFAFYPNKQVTTGEGGMVVSNRQDWAERVQALRNQGRAAGDGWLQHSLPGYNYRLDEMSAALGWAQMERLDELLAKRAQVAQWYQEALGPVSGIELPQVAASTTRMGWFVYVIRLDPSIDRATLMQVLADREIPSRNYFGPIHLQSYMVERYGYQPGDFPIAEDLGRRSLALPFSGVMPHEQVEFVGAALKEIIDGLG